MVFNLELQEGLEPAYLTGLDTDEFDAICDHLIVEHAPTKQIVGTYRLQTGSTAAANSGYYSAREFDFAPYEPLRNQIVELGPSLYSSRSSFHRRFISSVAGNCCLRCGAWMPLSDWLFVTDVAGWSSRHGCL